MMRNESDHLLNDLLCSWHKWASGWSGVAAHGSCAMFTGVRSSRQWDSANDVVDGTLHNQTMRAIDFQVSELSPIHRTAIQIKARNLVTGNSVWSSLRLPQDPEERAAVMMDAMNALTKRLYAAGVV